jgi:hypothetical protein
MSAGLRKRIRIYENTKVTLRRDFNLPSDAKDRDDETPKSKSRDRSIFSPFEDLLTQSSSRTPVDAAISCVNAWNEVEEYREKHDTYVRDVACETYDMTSIHYEYCRDGFRKYVVFLLNMLANSQFDARKLTDSVESIDVIVDMKTESSEENKQTELKLRELKSPCGEIHFLATSETEENKSRKRRNSTDIRNMFKSGMRDAARIMATTSNSLSEQFKKSLSPTSSSSKKKNDSVVVTTAADIVDKDDENDGDGVDAD